MLRLNCLLILFIFFTTNASSQNANDDFQKKYNQRMKKVLSNTKPEPVKLPQSKELPDSKLTYTVENITILGDIKGEVYVNESIMINAPDCPVQINNIKVTHVTEETRQLAKYFLSEAYSALNSSEKEKIRELSNSGLGIKISAQANDAVAVKFGVITIDAFKEYLGGLTAITMDPPSSDMTWNYTPAYLFKFEKYGVAVVYVRQVRLENGTIWNFNIQNTQKRLSGLIGEITEEQLTVSEN